MIIKRNIAVKFRAYPTAEQADLIERTIGCARFVYNLMLETRNAYYQSRFGNPGVQVRETLPKPSDYKDDYPFLREVDSLALCNAQMHLNKAYASFFDPSLKNGFPKYKAKHHSKHTYTTNCIKRNIQLDKKARKLKLPKVGWLAVRQHKKIPDDWKLKSVTVEHCKSGKYTATVLFEYETQAPEQVAPVNVVGLDYSSPSLFVSSDGECADYPRYFRDVEPRLAREQRKLSHMVKGSNNYAKQKRKIARLHEKTANRRLDYQHKLANRLVASCDAVAVEDLNMQNMSQSLTLGKSTMDNAFGQFRTLLKYKLEREGKQLVTVGKWFASSQLCHHCHEKNPAVKDLTVREWECPSCHHVNQRDINAALNIRDEAKRMLEEQSSLKTCEPQGIVGIAR